MIIKLIIFSIILAIPITLFANWNAKHKEMKFIQNKLDIIPDIKFDLDNLKIEDYHKMNTQEARRIYLELIDIETKIDKTEKHLDEIKFCIQLITFFVIFPLVIKIVLLILGIEIAGLML